MWRSEVNGTTITKFDGVEIDLGKWTRLTMREAIIKWWPEGAAPFLRQPTLEILLSRKRAA